MNLRRAALAFAPLVLLAVAVGALLVASPGFDRGGSPPDVTVTHHTVPDDETIVLHVTNNGPEDVTISQVMVDGAYWSHSVEGRGDTPETLAPRDSVRVVVPRHLTLSPDNEMDVTLLLSGGETVTHELVGVQTTSGLDGSALRLLALVGVFVGVIPVAIGMLWYPFIAATSKRRLHAVLAFAAGVLAFLAVDASFEAFEIAERVPGVYSGAALVVLSALAALLLVQAVSERFEGSGLRVAYLVAVAIGLHNLAEGLAIGGAYAAGSLSLAAFLVVGFMLHNVTEGPAVVAPLADERRPALYHFAALGVVAGAPVILGGWIGGAFRHPAVSAVFVAVGVGAILQVTWELAGLVRDDGGRVATPANMLAFLAGAVVMYATGLFAAL
ncbi:MAG: ZIP family metal transporter [Halobacteriota archaeon]